MATTEITEAQFAAANESGAAMRATYPSVVSVRYDNRMARVRIAFNTGLEMVFSPKLAQGLEHATPSDLVGAEISPSGLGIRFPRIDADLYVPGLLSGFLGSKRWMAAENGKRGGAVATTAKATAARANGRLGGRPRKVRVAELA
jgi:hypothetical protein